MDLTKHSHEELIATFDRASDLQDTELYQASKAELMRRLEPETTTAKDKYHRPQTSTTGVNAYFGKLPGDETEEELLEAVKEATDEAD